MSFSLIPLPWRLNGNNLPNSHTNVLTLSGVKTSDFGSYDVVVSNSFGSVTSAVAQLSLSRWSFAAWNDDATSGVAPAYFYTHTYKFGSAENADINGLTFAGVAGGNPALAQSFTLTGIGIRRIPVPDFRKDQEYRARFNALPPV